MTFSHEAVSDAIALESDTMEMPRLSRLPAKGLPLSPGECRVAVGPRADYGGVQVKIARGEVFGSTLLYRGAKENYSIGVLRDLVDQQMRYRSGDAAFGKISNRRMGETLTLVRENIGKEVEIYLKGTFFTPDYDEIISPKGELSEQDNFLFGNLRRVVAGLQGASDEVFAKASETGLITLRSINLMPGKMYRAAWLLPAVTLGLDLKQEDFKTLPARNVFCLVPEFTSAEVAKEIENRLFCQGESKGQLTAIEIA